MYSESLSRSLFLQPASEFGFPIFRYFDYGNKKGQSASLSALPTHGVSRPPKQGAQGKRTMLRLQAHCHIIGWEVFEASKRLIEKLRGVYPSHGMVVLLTYTLQLFLRTSSIHYQYHWIYIWRSAVLKWIGSCDDLEDSKGRLREVVHQWNENKAIRFWKDALVFARIALYRTDLSRAEVDSQSTHVKWHRPGGGPTGQSSAERLVSNRRLWADPAPNHIPTTAGSHRTGLHWSHHTHSTVRS